LPFGSCSRAFATFSAHLTTSLAFRGSAGDSTVRRTFARCHLPCNGSTLRTRDPATGNVRRPHGCCRAHAGDHRRLACVMGQSRMLRYPFVARAVGTRVAREPWVIRLANRNLAHGLLYRTKMAARTRDEKTVTQALRRFARRNARYRSRPRRQNTARDYSCRHGDLSFIDVTEERVPLPRA